MTLRRRAVTMIETLIFMTIAIILVVAAWKILSGGTRIGRNAVEGLQLQSGIRNLLENMSRDVNGAMLIDSPDAETAAPVFPATGQVNVVFYQHQGADPTTRIEEPGNEQSPYPFGRTQAASEYGLPVFRVIYQYDPTARTITRAVQSGLLKFRSTLATPGVVDEFEFRVGEERNRANIRRPPTVLARDVEMFEAYPLALNYEDLIPNSRIPKIVLASELPGAGNKKNQVIGFAIRAKAGFRQEGPPVAGAKDNSMEVLTKIFSYPKIYDMNYRRYFSSVDADLRY